MIRSFIILFFVQAITVFLCAGQPVRDRIPEDTLAMVDSWPVTSRDVFERLELMLFEEKIQDHDFESVKRKAVESLVGERLLALSFKESEVSDQWHFDRVGRVLEKMLVRDEMYKREIRDRALIEPSEIRQGLEQYAVKRRFLMVPCASISEALDLGREWRSLRATGESNSSILRSLDRQADTVVITFGSADTALERASFALKDTLSVSGPVQTTLYGIVIVSLLKDELNNESTKKSPSEREEAVKQILLERRESILANDFVDKVLRGKRMEADTAIFRMVTRRLWQILTSDSAARRVPKGFRFTQNDIFELLGEFKEKLDSPVGRGSFGELNLGDFLESLMYYDFAIPSLKPRSFVVSLFEILRTMTEAEMIAQEGSRRGYQNSANVMADESKWMEYWKSRYTEFAVVDTARMRDWEPVWSLWRYHTELVERTCVFKIQEVLRPDSLGAMELLVRLREGENLDSLARIQSIRTEWARNGGRSGWFRFQERPVIAACALAMDIGELAGPLRLREGYSVFRLVDRRFEGDTAGISLLLEQESRRMKMARQQSAINNFVAHQALSHQVDIFYKRIQEADIANVNMVTRRMVGFGGRMNAAPVLVPQWEWVREWNKLRQILQ